MKKLIQLSFVLVLALGCTAPLKKKDALGEVTFKVTGSEPANALFIKGHLLMHSFEYSDAAEVFIEAQKEDSTCVMAYWGEAMTYHHPIWQEQDYEEGKKALMKLGATSAERIGKASADIESDFLRAVEILYGEGTKTDRDSMYADFMGSLHEKYPGNHEVASLYALALLGSVPVGRDEDIYRKSARISEGILKENPNHPGALHYLIHADDDPRHAGEALFAANEYSVVAPDAAHALHMPTHIFVALGMWDKVISLNEESWRSSVDRKQRKNLSNDDLGYHSFYWLEYGYLQKGRVNDAQKLLEDMIRYCSEVPSKRAKVHEILMKSTYLVETDDWGSIYASHKTDIRELNVALSAREMFIRGMKSLRDTNMDTLAKVISDMKAVRLVESATVNEEGIAVCKSGGSSRFNTTQLDLDEAYVMEMELEGLRAWKNDDLAAADKWFKEAAALEQRISYSYGPPSIVKPSAELYGEFLVTVNRGADAMKSFDTSLKRAPKRVLSLKGKMEAAKMLKLDSEVSEIEKELSAI